MWPKCSHILQPLTRLKSKNVIFKWTDVEKKAFDEVKRLVACITLLNCPGFNKQFKINTDTSAFLLVLVTSQ